MAWSTPTLAELRAFVRDQVLAKLSQSALILPKSVTRGLAEAVAGLAHLHFRFQAWIARNVMPDSAEDDWLERWLGLWGTPRKPATAATGTLTVTGANGSAVPTGALLTAIGISPALEVEVTAGATISGGTATVTAQATEPGARGLLEAGQRLAFVSVPLGLDAQATVDAPGFVGGADLEGDEPARARMLNRIQEPPHGGNANDYEQWALQVPGVTRAWAYGQEMGIGTVTVRFMMDEVRAAQDGIPNAGDLALVEAHIDPLRPVTVRDLFVVAPLPKVVDVTIANLERDSPEVRLAIATNLAKAFRVKAEPGQTFWLSWISEAVSAAAGERRHTIQGGADVACATGEIAVLGSIAYV